jgi:sugar/nucleoside kinase (ribokinase family)
MDYLAIGHVTEDLWPEGPTPGGTVTYSSRSARAFIGQVSVLTAAGADLDCAAAFPSIAAYCIPAPSTTRFRNVYTDHGRVQVVSPCPITLQPAHLSDAMRQSDIVHLGPVCNEVSPDIVECVSPQSFVGVTPQGWMRRWDEAGHVTSRADNWQGAPQVLARANAVVISIDDVAGDWDMARRWAAQTALLVVTQGALGCTALSGDVTLHVPAPHVQEIEPTGAGDIFATVLFIALRQGATLRDACAQANCIAAQSVTRPRLSGIPTTQDVAHCAGPARKVK